MATWNPRTANSITERKYARGTAQATYSGEDPGVDISQSLTEKPFFSPRRIFNSISLPVREKKSPRSQPRSCLKIIKAEQKPVVRGFFGEHDRYEVSPSERRPPAHPHARSPHTQRVQQTETCTPAFRCYEGIEPALATPSSGSMSEVGRHSICTVCMCAFEDPRMLPCHHTFCAKCIDKLTEHKPTYFQCPICRVSIKTPSRGGRTFQFNFYLDRDELDLTSAETQCQHHTTRLLDNYCIECDSLVCRECRKTTHLRHSTRNLDELSKQFQNVQFDDQESIEKKIKLMEKKLAESKKELQALKEKTSAVEKSIIAKHATLVAVANTSRDDLIASLSNVSEKIERQNTDTIHITEHNIKKLKKLQRQTGEAGCRISAKLLAVPEVMRESHSSSGMVEHLMSLKQGAVCRPILKSSTTLEMARKVTENFLGTADTVQLELSKPEVLTVKKFSFAYEDGVDVCSLCPLDDGEFVWLSYEWYGMESNASCEKFDKHGALCCKSESAKGKATFKSRGSGECVCLWGADSLHSSYSKSQEGSLQYLSNHLKGKAFVKTLVITSEDPWNTDTTTDLTINVGPHRAFDVDSSQQLFVVLEEARSFDPHRKVLLYCRGQADAVATYSPPTTDCQPSDVCFYRLGGQEVLIVSDEGTDSLHVVEVGNGTMCFKRYLDPGCPLLVQPTALNTDTKGRLWIACRWGEILTMTPICA